MRISLKWTVLIASMLFLAASSAACGGGAEAPPAESETPPPAAASSGQAKDTAAAESDAAAGGPAGGAAESETPTETAGSDDPAGETMTEPNPALLDPSLASEQAPASFQARFETTKGEFVVQVNREWSPLGADRFYNLVKIGYFNDIAFFRVLEGFVAQFGIHGDPQVGSAWRQARIADDPVAKGNKRGTLVFATAGPDTRTTQLFINLVDNGAGDRVDLDSQGFSAFGEVVQGMDVVDQLYNGYGEGAPRGRGPNQMIIMTRGNEYLKKDFPRLDYVINAEIVG